MRGSTIALALLVGVAPLAAEAQSVTRPLPASSASAARPSAASTDGASFAPRALGALDAEALFTFAPQREQLLAAGREEEEEEEQGSRGFFPGALSLGGPSDASLRSYSASSASAASPWTMALASLGARARSAERLLVKSNGVSLVTHASRASDVGIEASEGRAMGGLVSARARLENRGYSADVSAANPLGGGSAATVGSAYATASAFAATLAADANDAPGSPSTPGAIVALDASGNVNWGVNPTVTVNPEPGTVALMGTGLAVLVGVARRRRQRA